MDLRLTFDEVAADYDKLRPTYVQELYNDIIGYSAINQYSHLLEVGVGTGQATLPFLKNKCKVTAIELGKNLAEFTKEKFASYKNFEIKNIAFEEYICPDNSIDMIYSASAFHWIQEEIGYSKVYRLLKSGGAFARFANNPFRDVNSPLHIAMQKVYEKYMPDVNPPSSPFSEEQAKARADIGKKYGFIDIRYKLYHRTRILNAENYATLIGTFSDHRALGEEKLSLLQNEIKDVINSFGGEIDLQDTINLQLSRKP